MTGPMLRMVTLNIWNMSGPWRQRRQEIVTWLDRLAPDVVCLQEVLEQPDGRNQAAWLADAAAGAWHTAMGPAWAFDGGGWFGNAVLSRQPVEAVSVTPLPFEHRPDDGPRALLHARTGGLDVFCTHLNWRYDDGAIRERQVQTIVEVIRAGADPEAPLPPILAGDMNAEPDSTEMRFLAGLTSLGGTSTYFQDAWRVAGGRGPGWTWDNRNSFAVHDQEPDRRIDYIYVGWRRDGGVGRIESARVVCDRALTGTFASDHFGLLAEISTVPAGRAS
jgi:endonuclease/exonuclease/phosphatase family metal-dependent hydrolase